MYLVFVGTTDYLELLITHLNTTYSGYTILEGFGGWQGQQLNSQVVIFFNREDALNFSKWCTTVINQQAAPVYSLQVEEIV